MKQYFYSLFAATAMLLATASCSQDELENAAQGNEVDVTFTLKQEGNTATRAIGDGTTATDLYFAAYDGDGNYLPNLQPTNKPANDNIEFVNKEASVKLRLVKGQTYSFVFWAQQPTTDAFTLDFDDTFATANVTVNYGKAANDEKRDAFWTTKTYTITGPLTENIVLKRPFAQVNVGVKKGELKEANDAGVLLKKSSFKFDRVANVLNMSTGKVTADENDKSAAFTIATTPANWDGTTYNGEYLLDVDGEDYEYIAMNYILVNNSGTNEADGTKQELINPEFTLYDGDAITGFKTYKVPNLPVQRNWRTNIIASIMSDAEFKIVIDPIFDGDINYPSESEEKLAFAAENGGEVTLTEDVTLDGTLTVTSNMVLNLNGKTITNKVDNKTTDVIVVKEGATLTINGEEGGVSAVTGNDGYAIIVEGTLNINGGTYTSGLDKNNDGNCVIYARKSGKINIYGGYFDCLEDDGKTYLINKKGDAVDTAEIKVYGGKFNSFNPADNPADGPHTNYVAEGYYSCLDGDCYVVSNSQMVNTIANLKAAIENGGEITLVGDVEVTDFLEIGKETTLNLNGHTLTQPETATADAVLAVKRGATLTIEGDGEIVSATGAAVKLTMKGETGEETAKLVVNGGKLTGKWWGITGNGSRHNTEIVINDGVITATEDNGLGIFHPQVGTLTINGGEISGVLAGVEMRAGTLNITGGKLTATAETFDINANGSGSTIQGAAVGVSQHNGDNDIAVTISGGEFNGVYAFYEEDVQNQNSSNISVSITGGTFNGKVYTENGNKENVKVTVANSEVLTDAVEKGYEVVLGKDIKLAKTVKGSANIDGNGYTMTIAKNESQHMIQPTGGVIKNLTITGYNTRNTNEKVLRGIYATPAADLLIENCHISGVAYPLNTGSAKTTSKTLTVKNSTLVGWTSFSGGLAVANFSNTHFGIGTFFGKDSDPAWNGCIKPYVNTTLTDCSFENGFYIDFSELTAGETLKLKNCKVGNTVLTAQNIWSLLNYTGTPAEGVLVFE